MFSFFFFWAIWNGYSIVRLSLTCQTDLDKPWLDYPQQPRRNKFIYLFLYFVSLLIPTFIRFYFVPICAVSNQCVKHIYFFFENMNRNKRSKSRAVLQIYNWLCTDHKRKYFFPLFDFQDYFDDISFFFLPASWRSDEKKIAVEFNSPWKWGDQKGGATWPQQWDIPRQLHKQLKRKTWLPGQIYEK